MAAREGGNLALEMWADQTKRTPNPQYAAGGTGNHSLDRSGFSPIVQHDLRRSHMNKTVALAVAALSLTLAATSVLADDQTPSGSTKEEQATKARQAKAQKDQDTIIKATQDPQGRNISINKTGEATPA